MSANAEHAPVVRKNIPTLTETRESGDFNIQETSVADDSKFAKQKSVTSRTANQPVRTLPLLSPSDQ